MLKDCGAKVVVTHSDLLPQVATAGPDGVPLFVVPTPPEIAAAYGIADELCLTPAGSRLWAEWVADFAPMPEGPVGAVSRHLGHHGKSQGRASPRPRRYVRPLRSVVRPLVQ